MVKGITTKTGKYYRTQSDNITITHGITPTTQKLENVGTAFIDDEIYRQNTTKYKIEFAGGVGTTFINGSEIESITI